MIPFLGPPTAGTVALICSIRSKGGTVDLSATSIQKDYNDIKPRKSTHGEVAFGVFAPNVTDEDILELAAFYGEFHGKLNLSGCSQLTDASLSEVAAQCTQLASLDLSGTQTTVPWTTRQRGVAAVRRYYAQLAAGSVTCTKLKAVVMGKGTAGKTSLVRALGALETGVAPVLPDADDRTIGVEMTLLFETFAVHDFGGQPEYYPWHKLFLSSGALYLLVADLSEGVAACCAALEDQLGILSASVPGAPVLVILTKTDLVASGDTSQEVRKRVVEVERRMLEWCGARQLRRAGGDDFNVRLQMPVLSASSETQEGIEAVRERMNAAASAGDGAAKLFPQFNSNVPMTYEKVRVLLDAILTGQRDLAKAVDASLRPDKRVAVRHFLPFSELLEAWTAVLGVLPVLRGRIEASSSDPEAVLRDALDMLQGEGSVLFSDLSGIVHMNPTWLASAVRPLADHRLEKLERRREIARAWVAKAKERVVHSGHLEKRSDYLKKWNRRFFKFEASAAAPFLRYFKNEADKKERGRLGLRGASVSHLSPL